MNEQNFVDQSQKDWGELKVLCEKGSVSSRYLAHKDFVEFIRLYRKVSRDLAVLRTQGANPVLIEFVNDLVGNAHSILYQAPRKGFFFAVQAGLLAVVTAARRQKQFFFFSIGLFLFSALLVGSLMSAIPGSRSVFIPMGSEANVQGWVEGLPDRSPEDSALATGMYASNNPMAILSTGSLGLATFGVGSLYELYKNAEGVGALGHEMAAAGKLPFLIISLMPHGLSEIGGFMLAAAAGLSMGYALINPGRLSRAAALAAAGKDAIVLLTAGVIMTWIAAPIEGWFSFNSHIPIAIKVLFIIVEGTGWFLFFNGYGKPRLPKVVKLDRTSTIIAPSQD